MINITYSKMRKVSFSLILIAAALSPFHGFAQWTVDYFDEDNLSLNRIIWDDTISAETEECIQEWSNSDNWETRILAYFTAGVHLELCNEINSTRPSEETRGFEYLFIQVLNEAKRSRNIDSVLLKSIDTLKLFNSSRMIHREGISDYLLEILTIRYTKKERETNIYESLPELTKLPAHYFSSFPTSRFALAKLSKAEILDSLNYYVNLKTLKDKNLLSFYWAMPTYRGVFLNDLKKYCSKSNFSKLSVEGQNMVFNYWCFNLDLINRKERLQLLPLTIIKDSLSESIVLSIRKIALHCLIENATKEEFIQYVSNLGDKEANKKYKVEVQKQIQKLLPILPDSSKAKESTNGDKSNHPIGFRRPESFVHRFDSLATDDIITYIKDNLKTILYVPTGFLKNDTTINIRAATQELGNRFYNKKEVKTSDPRFVSIVSTLVDLGILGCNSCYGESSTLIYGLGELAVPALKAEFFNQDKIRVQFATQKLIELKNEEIVKWVIEQLDKNSQNQEFQKWGRIMLKTMKEYREMELPHRGLSKSESDQLAREIIKPYLEKN